MRINAVSTEPSVIGKIPARLAATREQTKGALVRPVVT